MLEFSMTTTRTRTTSQLRNFALAVATLASMGGVISGIALSKGDLWALVILAGITDLSGLRSG